MITTGMELFAIC